MIFEYTLNINFHYSDFTRVLAYKEMTRKFSESTHVDGIHNLTRNKRTKDGDDGVSNVIND